MSPSHVTTREPTLWVFSGGCWLGKSSASVAPFLAIYHGKLMLCPISSSTETLKSKKRRKLQRLRLPRPLQMTGVGMLQRMPLWLLLHPLPHLLLLPLLLLQQLALPLLQQQLLMTGINRLMTGLLHQLLLPVVVIGVEKLLA